MNDNTSTRLTGSIRKILDGRTPRGVNPADLARQYCERCIRLEVTIRDCLKLLRSNQFGELVRMVEQTSIFENLAAVEFPGRDRWQDLCAANGWDVPPEFDEVDVDDLNDGYAQGSDIQGLMDRRRVANLKRDHKSAVTWLRALSEKQPENESWKQELRLAEKSRLDELGAEVPQAVGAKDYAKLRGLRRELACDWIAAGSADSLKAQVTLTLAECTAEKLAEAFSSRSEGDLQTHLKDIDDYVASGDFTPPDAMGQQIDMARSWLAVRNEEHAKQQKYDDLVAKITDMVARDRLNLKLVTIWQQLLTMEQQPPGDLVPQVSSCLWEQEDKRIAESRARFLKGILAAVAALILIGAISGAYMSWSGNNTRIQLITQALGRRDVNEARQLLDRLTREKSYLTWRVDVEGFEQQATDIEADIVSKHRAVELALKRLTSVSDTNWNQSSEETATLFDTLHKAITDAGSDAPEGSEKKHNELSKSWESTCSMRQIERNKIFMDRVAALRKRVQDLPAGLQNDTGKLTDLIDQISRLQDEAGRIGMDATGVSGTFKSTLGTVKGDLGTVRECAEMRLKALTRFRDARTLESYLKNAAEFANLCDDKELTSRLERIAATQEFAKALIAYPGVGRDGAMTAANLKRALVKVPEENPYWHKLLSERFSTLTLHDENVAKVATSIGDLKENESFVRAWRVNFSLPDPDDEQLLLRMKSGFLLTKKLAEANAQEDPLYYGERLGEIYAERLIQRDVQIPNPSKRDLKRRKYIGMPRIAYKSYVPETEDTEAVFEEEEIYIRGRTIPKLLPHCAYIRSLLGQYEAIRTGSPVLFLLLRTAELHQVWLASAAGPDRATAELEPRVVLLLMVDFIGHLERLVGTWCLPPSLLEFKEDAGKLELETNWFCQNTRSYRLERNEIVHLLRKKKYRFNPVQLINGCFLRVAATDVCLARGIEWVGRRGVLPGEDPWVLNRKTPPTEIWVLREIGNGESMMLKLAARRGEDGQLKQAMADSALRPGELLFGPKQGTTTTQIIEKIARRCNVDADALRAELMNPEARKEGRYLSWPFEEGENGAP